MYARDFVNLYYVSTTSKHQKRYGQYAACVTDRRDIGCEYVRMWKKRSFMEVLQHLTRSVCWSLTHLLTHSLTHLLTHSINYSLTHLLTHSFTHSLTIFPSSWHFLVLQNCKRPHFFLWSALTSIPSHMHHGGPNRRRVFWACCMIT